MKKESSIFRIDYKGWLEAQTGLKAWPLTAETSHYLCIKYLLYPETVKGLEFIGKLTFAFQKIGKWLRAD